MQYCGSLNVRKPTWSVNVMAFTTSDHIAKPSSRVNTYESTLYYGEAMVRSKDTIRFQTFHLLDVSPLKLRVKELIRTCTTSSCHSTRTLVEGKPEATE